MSEMIRKQVYNKVPQQQMLSFKYEHITLVFLSGEENWNFDSLS